MALSYSLREGLAGFRRAKFAVIASTMTMTVALVLIGLFGLLNFEAQRVADLLRQRVGEVELFLQDVEDPVAEALSQRAAAMPGVIETEYISREEAQRIFREEFGEGAEVFFDELFLPASIRVRVDPDYATPDSLARMVEQMSRWNRVDEVVFNQPLLVKVQENLRLLTLAGLALGVVVLLAAIFLVANTIRLTIYARRLLIRTMKLVGATDPFIRQPFLFEGILQGVIAGLTSGLAVWGLYRLLVRYYPELAVPGGWLGPVLVAGLLGMGILLGWLGSYAAVRRFIKSISLH
ncbi:ABC transporter permease [Rhodothermaceae bacterium RA]|nr:ABC transporter permease [Rhodothermaceae bacterium RA]